MTFNFKTNWRTTTALCIASTIAFATAAHAASPLSLLDQLIADLENDLRILSLTGNNNNNNNKDKDPANTAKTASPIKHVIILIGENRGLDHTFGVYKPKGAGQTISNLLSKGIVNEDGTPGPNFALAQQFSVAGQPSYYIGAPTIGKSPYGAANTMPQPNTNGAPSAQSATGAPFQTIAQASVEKDINPA